MLVLVVSVLLWHFLVLSCCGGTSWTWRCAPSTASWRWLWDAGRGAVPKPLLAANVPVPCVTGHTQLVLGALGRPWGGTWMQEPFPWACFAALGEVGGGGWWLQAPVTFLSCPHSHTVLVRPRCLCHSPGKHSSYLLCRSQRHRGEERMSLERGQAGMEVAAAGNGVGPWGQWLNTGHSPSSAGPSFQGHQGGAGMGRTGRGDGPGRAQGVTLLAQ